MKIKDKNNIAIGERIKEIKYLAKMTPEQSRCVEDLVSAYAKSCGIN